MDVEAKAKSSLTTEDTENTEEEEVVATALGCRAGSNNESNSWLEKIRTGKNLTKIWGKSPAMVSICRAAAAAYLGRRAVAVLPPSFGWKFPRRETSHLPSNDSLPQSTLPVGGTPTLLEGAALGKRSHINTYI